MKRRGGVFKLTLVGSRAQGVAERHLRLLRLQGSLLLRPCRELTAAGDVPPCSEVYDDSDANGQYHDQQQQHEARCRGDVTSVVVPSPSRHLGFLNAFKSTRRVKIPTRFCFSAAFVRLWLVVDAKIVVNVKIVVWFSGPLGKTSSVESGHQSMATQCHPHM